MVDKANEDAPARDVVTEGDRPLTRADMAALVEWLDARLERIDARFARLDDDTGDVTRQITGDLMGLRADLLYLHERLDAGQSLAVLADGVRAEIARGERARARRANRRTLAWLVIALVIALSLLLGPGLNDAVFPDAGGSSG